MLYGYSMSKKFPVGCTILYERTATQVSDVLTSLKEVEDLRQGAGWCRTIVDSGAKTYGQGGLYVGVSILEEQTFKSFWYQAEC